MPPRSPLRAPHNSPSPEPLAPIYGPGPFASSIKIDSNSSGTSTEKIEYLVIDQARIDDLPAFH